MKAWCYPMQVLVSKLVKCPMTDGATAYITGASSMSVQQVCCVIAGPADDTR